MRTTVKTLLLCTTALTVGFAKPADADPLTAIISAASAYSSTYLVPAAAGSLFGLSLPVSFLARTAIGLGLSALSQSQSRSSAASASAGGYDITATGTALDHQIIYGMTKTGGVRIYDEATGTNNKYLHRIIAFTGHEIESFEEIHIDDNVATINGSGDVTLVTDRDGGTSDRYSGKLRIKEHLGSVSQTADTDLVAESAQWTADHTLNGISYLYIRAQFDSDVFPNGMPNISAVIKGKKVYDPRTTLTAWSDNSALCIRDYLTSDYGLAESADNIDDTLVTAAANVCDETNTLGGETRYTCNGAFTTDATPENILGGLLTSMGGMLWYGQGKWKMKPAYWTAASLTLDEDDLRSNIKVSTRHSRRDNYNGVVGTFRGAESSWQTTDYPKVDNAGAFVTIDGGLETDFDLALPYTDTSVEARRIARINLEARRQQLTISATFGMRAFEVEVGDNVLISNTRFGWTNKVFEVLKWSLVFDADNDVQVNLTLQETASSVFDEVADGVVYEKDNTSLLSPYTVPTVGITVTSELFVSREKLTNKITIETTSGNAESIDLVEVQYKVQADSDWISVGTNELGYFTIPDLVDETYDFRARAINTFGIKGEWATTSLAVTGLGDAPTDVEGFSGQVMGSMLYLQWDQSPDLDLSYYKIRHSSEETGASWGDATTAVEKIPRPATSISLPARSGTYHIRAYDKNGTGSGDYTSIVIPSADLEVFGASEVTRVEATSFSGTKTGCSVSLSQLVITDTSTAPSEATYDFSSTVDIGSVSRARCWIEAEIIRKDDSAGLFDDLVGNFDNLTGNFDDLTSSGDFDDTNVLFYIDVSDDNLTWSGYKIFQAGEYSGRYFRFRAVLKSSGVNITPALSALTAYVRY